MPRTIDEGFRDLLPKLTPTTTETTSAKSHRASIKSCLKTNFGLLRFFRTGSFGNGTSISSYSDVDYFASIPTNQLKKDSKMSLTEIRNQLNTTFHSTNVRVDSPAIVCPFGTNKKETTEIIPCDLIGKNDYGFSIFEIADGNGDLMRVSPEMHNAYIKQEDERLNGKLKPLIRFIKAWKYYKDAKISSFYLELRIAKLMEKETYISYSTDITTIINWLYYNDLPSIQDPMGISGYIYPCKTQLQKEDALLKLKTATIRVNKARELENNEKIKEAFDYWNLFFNKRFPNYYY